MSLFETWRETAYKEEDPKKQKKFWKDYFDIEKGIYKKILSKPEEAVKGTVEELAEKFDTDLLHFTGFLDGINGSLKEPKNLEELKEDAEVELSLDLEKLYYNMLVAKAKWLYTLPQWDDILSEDRRKEITKKQRLSGTVIKGETIGRNDPCPCGSGKKYKKCCGAN